MNNGLDKDWITAPAIDLELKRYILLAYLQRVQARFEEGKLYPHLSDLQDHLDRLAALQKSKSQMEDSLPRELVGIDVRTGRLRYASLDDDAWLHVIEEVIAFALPELHRSLGTGIELREEIGARIHFAPVGVLPLRTSEGYLLLRQGTAARVYAYSIPLVQGAQEVASFRSVHTRYVTSYAISISWQYEHIKADLIRQDRSLPNPATFVFETERPIPHIETYMPIAKQLMVSHISREAA